MRKFVKKIIRELLTEKVCMHGSFYYRPPVGVDFADTFREKVPQRPLAGELRLPGRRPRRRLAEVRGWRLSCI